MKYNKETKQLTDVCLTDINSIPAKANNSSDLIKDIKNQLDNLVKKGHNLGILGFNDSPNLPLDRVAFTYNNIRINEEDGLIYADLTLLDTPQGKNLRSVVSDEFVLDTCRCVLTGVGRVEQGNIFEYQLSSVDFILDNNFSF